MAGVDDQMLDLTPLVNSKSSAHGRNGAHFFTTFFQPCVVELFATALFVFMGTMSVQTGNQLLIALAHGLTIALLVTAFAESSGAHINPAVTIGVLIGGGIGWSLAVFYIFAQLVGATLGAALTRGVLSFTLPSSHDNGTIYFLIKGGSHELSPGLSVGQGILCEVIMTLLLVSVVLMVAVDKTNVNGPLAIGLTVFADIAISANLTGGSMNPGRSFGPAIVISDLYMQVWHHHYVYWIGPLSGAILAAIFYRLMFASSKNRLLYGEFKLRPSNTSRL